MSIEPRTVTLAGWTITLSPAEKNFPDAVQVVVAGGGRPTPYFDRAWCPGDPVARRRLFRGLHESFPEAFVEQLAAEAIQWAEGAWEIEQRRLAAAREHAAKGGSAFAPFALTARQITQAAVEGQTFSIQSVQDALAILTRHGFAPDTKVEWPKEHLGSLAMLDIDFHSDAHPKPTSQELDIIGEDLAPAPWAWWRTQGGGIHAVYGPINHAPYTAEELAAGAAAAVACLPVVVRCGGTVEIIASSRHPLALQKGKSCGPIRQPGSGPTDVFACLQRFSVAGATQDEIDDVMEELGYTLGQRLDHSHCLIDPNHVSKSPNPVLVGENGLFCYSCAGRDGNGMMSWNFVRQKHGMSVARVTEDASPIRGAVNHFAHFHHVNYLLGSIAPELPERFRRPLYSALLKRRHLNDPRIGKAFSGFKFVRGYRQWLHADDLTPVGKPLQTQDVNMLPSTMILAESEDGPEAVVEPTLLSAHTNNGTIDGWTPIQPLRATPIYSVFNTPTAREGLIFCRPKKESNGATYLPPSKRIKAKDYECILDAHYPGIPLTYLKAVIIAGGCAESGTGPIPMLWATGPTGSAKTSALKLAVHLMGDEFKEIAAMKEDRLEEAFGQAAEHTRFVVFDDFAKVAESFIKLQAFFTRLNREGFSYHKLYHGLTTVPVNSALILTDWKMPLSYVNQPQFARRAHLIRLPKQLQPWSEMPKLKIRPKWWKQNAELEQAANSFYSDIVDQFFPEGDEESFDAKMKKLGVKRLQAEAGDFLEQRDILREHVYDLIVGICQAQVNHSTAKRVGRGFVDIAWRQAGTVSAACTALVESLGDVEFTEDNLNHALEPYKLELDQLFPLKRSATLTTRCVGNRTYIRLTQEGTDANKAQLINHELMAQWPLAADHREKVLSQLSAVPSVVHRAEPQVNGHNGRANGHNGHALPTIPVLPQLPGIAAAPNPWFTIT